MMSIRIGEVSQLQMKRWSRNYYRNQEQSGLYTGTDDIRGIVYLWGSIVQFRRGYMKRNNLVHMQPLLVLDMIKAITMIGT